MKIFVENSALFYYEKSKVYSKETRKAAITAKPLPASPLLEASTAAFIAIRF